MHFTLCITLYAFHSIYITLFIYSMHFTVCISLCAFQSVHFNLFISLCILLLTFYSWHLTICISFLYAFHSHPWLADPGMVARAKGWWRHRGGAGRGILIRMVLITALVKTIILISRVLIIALVKTTILIRRVLIIALVKTIILKRMVLIIALVKTIILIRMVLIMAIMLIANGCNQNHTSESSTFQFGLHKNPRNYYRPFQLD